jgi:hypothetical protein
MCNLLLEAVIDANYMYWNSTVVELSSVITDHMHGGSVHFGKWIVEVSSYACGLSFFGTSNKFALA